MVKSPPIDPADDINRALIDFFATDTPSAAPSSTAPSSAAPANTDNQVDVAKKSQA